MVDRATGEPLIFPIGHYLGAHVPSGAGDAEFHVVRIGWDLYRLHGEAQLAVWALAYGVPVAGDEGQERLPWTRSAIHGAARAAGIPNVAAVLADLIDQDLLIEVVPGTPDAVEFARVCRTRSLLVGVGNTADEPQLYGIGPADDTSAIRVPALTYELWKWGHACDSLWHACQMLAVAEGAVDSEHADPERVLGDVLAAVQVLLAHGAIYLDEAREEALEVV